MFLYRFKPLDELEKFAVPEIKAISPVNLLLPTSSNFVPGLEVPIPTEPLIINPLAGAVSIPA